LLPLRYPKSWAVVGWLLVAAVIVGSLVPGTNLPKLGISDKIEHAGAYCMLMVWFSGLYRRPLYPLIAAVLLFLGIGLDLLQGLTRTRSLDWRDMVANGVGIAIGLVAARYFLGGWCQRIEQRLLS
jgi:VanZ family protein